MGALLGRNEDRLAMRDGQRGCRPTSLAREGGRRGRAWHAQRGRGRREEGLWTSKVTTNRVEALRNAAEAREP